MSEEAPAGSPLFNPNGVFESSEDENEANSKGPTTPAFAAPDVISIASDENEDVDTGAVVSRGSPGISGLGYDSFEPMRQMDVSVVVPTFEELGWSEDVYATYVEWKPEKSKGKGKQATKGDPNGVRRVVYDFTKANGELWFNVELNDGRNKELSFYQVYDLPDGEWAIAMFNNPHSNTKRPSKVSRANSAKDRSTKSKSRSNTVSRVASMSKSRSVSVHVPTPIPRSSFTSINGRPSLAELAAVSLSSENGDEEDDEDELLALGSVSRLSGRNSSRNSREQTLKHLQHKRRAQEAGDSEAEDEEMVEADEEDKENRESLGSGSEEDELALPVSRNSVSSISRRTRSRGSVPVQMLGYDSPVIDDEEEKAAEPRSRDTGRPIRRAATNRSYKLEDTPKKSKGRRSRAQSESDEDEFVELSRGMSTRRTSGRASALASVRSSARNSRRPRLESSGEEDALSSSEEEANNRRSGRNKRKRDLYAEKGEDDIEEVVVKKPTTIRQLHSKEVFPQVDLTDKFVKTHRLECDVCDERGDSVEKGLLVCCQGCSMSYHKECIGARSGREHLVTKVSDSNFVLQCKRCIGKYRMKDSLAPELNKCTSCRATGKACAPFKSLKKVKKSAADEGRLTPPTEVAPTLMYQVKNLLFRCYACKRAWHYDHLPERPCAKTDDMGNDNLWKKRYLEYKRDFQCLDCSLSPWKLQSAIGWRPTDPKEQTIDADFFDFSADDKELLVKWQDRSYFDCKWMPSAWVHGRYQYTWTHLQKKPPQLSLTIEDAVPEDFLRIEVVFDVEFSSIVRNPEVDVELRRIQEVTSAYVKFIGLGYEDAVWVEPPLESDEERYRDWKKAYEHWVHGHYVPRGNKDAMKNAQKARSLPFSRLEKKGQPEYVKGGQLMSYQVDGLNWLYHSWWKKQNVILADEMGLGKTVQIVSFLTALHEEHRLWPFLIVVPHSTVTNWKREMEFWSPNLRVVTFFGSDVSRKMAKEYELFHEGTSMLKTHVVVTSYDAPSGADGQILKRIPWECMVVDEGQRLKNDASLLYNTLKGFKIKHKVLLTGTPLQNKPRELFNLLQFLDPADMDAAKLEEEYGELTKENVPELHKLIRPYFLRRTKAQVLTNLPPMAEIILPVSLSAVQKKLYRSILAKDPNLIRSILSRGGPDLKKKERAKLNNILMQLRKCVCHPFIYNQDIEEQLEDSNAVHQNLVEAGSKLGLLNVMLPKLKERGHRVLIFSQFLAMLDIMEDFLNHLELKHFRLDGNVSSMEKQKRIDAYNAPNSDYFAFILSTRAGGVGINLATADTVIIMDPDFNPHQDIQALSRAHRIGQKNKVLVFHLVTKDTAEERIMQIGKKKMSMDHLIIDKMGEDELEDLDIESVLKFGAKKLFEDDENQKDLKYDEKSVDRLIDRSHVEQTKDTDEGGEHNSENAFSYARIWANDTGTLEDQGIVEDTNEEQTAEESTFWDRVLREREEEARKEEAAKMQEFGRGRRRKANVVKYAVDGDDKKSDEGSDGDFKAGAASDTESEISGEGMDIDLADVLPTGASSHGSLAAGLDGQASSSISANSPSGIPAFTNVWKPIRAAGFPGPAPGPPNASNYRPILPFVPAPPGAPPFSGLPFPPNFNMHPGFNPAQQVPFSQQPGQLAAPHHGFVPADPNNGAHNPFMNGNAAGVANMGIPVPAPAGTSQTIDLTNDSSEAVCNACQLGHAVGECRLREAGIEVCPLCEVAHLSGGAICPNLNSITQIDLMLDALRNSNEDSEAVEWAKQYLRGRKGTIKRARDRERDRERKKLANQPAGTPTK